MAGTMPGMVMEPMLTIPSEVTHVEEAVEINTLLELVVSSRGAQAVHAYPRLKLIVSHGTCSAPVQLPCCMPLWGSCACSRQLRPLLWT